jgi:hypothetical protein
MSGTCVFIRDTMCCLSANSGIEASQLILRQILKKDYYTKYRLLHRLLAAHVQESLHYRLAYYK